MDELIQNINQLQRYSRKYEFAELDLPQIIVVGSQSSGKSSVLERTIGYDILPKGSTLATRCPIIIQMINVPESECSDDELFGFINGESEQLNGTLNISQKLEKLTDGISNGNQPRVTPDPIEIRLYGSRIPTLTMVDLPGIITNDGIMEQGSKETIIRLSEQYAEKNLSIILAVSSANVDLANSDSIRIAQKFDPQGTRTIHVLTKVDIMDRGTNVRSMLKSEFLTKCITKICVVNRSQQNVSNKRSIDLSHSDEKNFFATEYTDIHKEHGIFALTKKLVRTLTKQIAVHLPTMINMVSDRMDSLDDYVQSFSFAKSPNILRKTTGNFVENYKNLIVGLKEQSGESIEGGAQISLILYTEFENDMRALKIQHLTREKIVNTIRNCCGNRKMSFALEEPFKQLIRKEIREFEKPTLQCLNRVRDLLRKFVKDVINELEITMFNHFALRIEEKMVSTIHERYVETKKTLMDLVRCEANDVFCAHPNSHFFDNVAEKLKDESGNVFDVMLDDISDTMPAPIKGLFKAANKYGVIESLIDTIECSGGQVTNNLDQVFNKKQIDSLDKTGLDEYFEDISDVQDVLEKIKKTSAGENNSFQNQLDVTIVETMIFEYFNQVRNNMIYNIPKWIQTLLIYDLLEKIKNDLDEMVAEDPDNLMRLDAEVEERLERSEEELKELKTISKNLWQIRR